mmetsp:Transcript_69683/g.122920  ORF Transcript_69683/g.122920 Transcript_69683/m.122920 type:complete len:303 (-) Transcript_69683:475-1383(-)
MTCVTATISFAWSTMGIARMVRVVYPIRLSVSGEKRGSWYASWMFSVAPTLATLPAIPCPMATRISDDPASVAILEMSSSRSLSTKNKVQRSAINSSLMLLMIWSTVLSMFRMSVCASFRKMLTNTSVRRFSYRVCWYNWWLRMQTPANVENASKSSSSSLVKGPPLVLLRSCATATIEPSNLTGMHKMLRVRYPVSMSTDLLNLGSCQASTMLMLSPVVATCPAKPVVIGMRISPAPRAIFDTSSSSSTRKKVQRSASKSWHAPSIVSSIRLLVLSIVEVVMLRATCNNSWAAFLDLTSRE